MVRIISAFLFSVAILLLAGCGSDGDDNPATVDHQPSSVTDLSVSSVGDSSITLSWTAPSDPSKTAVVSGYDLRYSTSSIDTSNWAAAIQVGSEPSPGDSGVTETLTIDGLDLGATYHFALKSKDDAEQWSALSNILEATTDSVDNRLIAYYPLIDGANDLTGNHGPMVLTNTPWQSGGIYCNGIYNGSSDPNACHAITPNLDSLDFDAFTIRARFQVSEYSDPSYNPVFIGGESYRWCGFYLLPDSTVGLMYNGAPPITSSVKYTTGTRHEGTITYDGSTETFRLYLDNQFACEVTSALVHGENPNVGITHGGNGVTFEGILGRLKIYNGLVTPQ